MTQKTCGNKHVLSADDIKHYRSGPKMVCSICVAIRGLRTRKRVKEEVIYAYGGKCCWPLCSISDPDMLVLDHVKDDGYQERSRRMVTGDSVYRKAKSLGFPDYYQILCSNHNLKKELNRKRQKVQLKISDAKKI